MVNSGDAPMVFGDGEMVDEKRRDEGMQRVGTP
jgi:hypothetical protein